MLHIWLIPLLVILALLVVGFYWLIRREGGSGERQVGRSLVDQPAEEEDPPPQGR